jgi:antitoxin (DNA-binding transcriptional repressor) of toxin-antitoxin stability system
MIKANIHEVKAKLSEYLDRAVRGEHIIICRHNRPVAELRAVTEVRIDPRPIGPLPGRPTFDIPAPFFEPMSEDELNLWEGVTDADPLSPAWAPRRERGASKVAETKGTFSSRAGRRPARRRP